MFDAEQPPIYANDYEKRQLYPRFFDLDQIQEIHVQLNGQSIAGLVARNKRTVNLADAYDGTELSRSHPMLTFDDSWDQKTGVLQLRTQKVLTALLQGTRTKLKTSLTHSASRYITNAS